MFDANPYAATQSQTTLDDKPLIGFAPEPKKAPSPKTKVYKPSLLKAYDQPEMWRKLEEGMLKKEVIAILGEPLRIGSDGKSELWYYNGDSALTSRVDFDKKLLRFRVASWKAPDFRL